MYRPYTKPKTSIVLVLACYLKEGMTENLPKDGDFNDPEEDSGSKTSRYKKKLLRAKLSADRAVLETALQLASDKNIRITKLADTVLLDPIITLEVLSRANISEGLIDKAGITAVQTAVIRIGSEKLAELFSEIRSREHEVADEDVILELESLRKLASRAGAVAEILASHLQRDISETAHAAANLAYTGQMLCCKVLGRSYLEFSSLRRRSALAYKLQSTFHIDLQAIHLQYLKEKGLPGFMFYAYDKELKCKTSAQSSLRFITDSAVEIVEAIEDGKWDKYRSTNTFPAKSNLRLLKLHDGIYDSAKEEIEEALNFNGQTTGKPDNEKLDLSIQDTAGNLDLGVTNGANTPSEPTEPLPNQTLVLSREEMLKSNEIPVEIKKRVEDTGSAANKTGEYSRNELSVNSQALFGLMQYLCQEANSVSTLLKDLMSILTEQGPFTRAAVIKHSSQPNDTIIHSAIGEDFEAFVGNETLAMTDDPLSPVALLATRVQSYNSSDKEDGSSPFGITSYAISPINLNSIAPLILYADCGVYKPVPLEARKVFRMVIQLLNEVLPQVAERSQSK